MEQKVIKNINLNKYLFLVEILFNVTRFHFV